MGRLVSVLIVFVVGGFVVGYLLGYGPGELIGVVRESVEGLIEEVTDETPPPVPDGEISKDPLSSGDTALAEEELGHGLLVLRVTNTGAVGLRIRASPAIHDDNILARVVDGTLLQSDTVTHTADGYDWTRVWMVGWMAENWLSPGPVSGFVARVSDTGGAGLRIRATPEVKTGNILGIAREGARVLVSDGPQFADGYQWWKVQFAGWAAADYLTDRVEDVPVTNTVDERRIRLEERINFWIRNWPSMPDYLLDPDSFQRIIAITGLVLTDLATRTDPIAQYADLYQLGVEWDGLAWRSLIEARTLLKRVEIDRAEELFNQSLRYQVISFQAFTAAAESLDRNYAVAEQLFDGIRRGSQTAVKFGLVFVHPKVALAADYVYVGVDYAVERALLGEDEANRRVVVRLVLTTVVKGVPFQQLGGMTIADYSQNVASDQLRPLLQEVLRSDEARNAVMQIIPKLATEFGISITEDIMHQLVDDMVEYLEKTGPR